MDGKELQEVAKEAAERLPGSALEFPFGPDWDVLKVRGKVFLLMTEVPGQPVVILKSDPEEANALRQNHAEITPGYHMNKRHWITLAAGRSVSDELVDTLVAESYRLVVDKLPRPERPVDPDTFGRSARRRA